MKFKKGQTVNVYGRAAKITKINPIDSSCITVRTITGKRFNMLCRADEILESTQPFTVV